MLLYYRIDELPHRGGTERRDPVIYLVVVCRACRRDWPSTMISVRIIEVRTKFLPYNAMVDNVLCYQGHTNCRSMARLLAFRRPGPAARRP